MCTRDLAKPPPITQVITYQLNYHFYLSIELQLFSLFQLLLQQSEDVQNSVEKVNVCSTQIQNLLLTVYAKRTGQEAIVQFHTNATALQMPCVLVILVTNHLHVFVLWENLVHVVCYSPCVKQKNHVKTMVSVFRTISIHIGIRAFVRTIILVSNVSGWTQKLWFPSMAQIFLRVY